MSGSPIVAWKTSGNDKYPLLDGVGFTRLAELFRQLMDPAELLNE